MSFFLVGAIISELLSLMFYDRIISSFSKDPEEILRDPVLKLLSFFSLSYIILILMLLFSGIYRFGIYGLIISSISIVELILKSENRGRILRVTFTTAITLTLLIDIGKNLVNYFF